MQLYFLRHGEAGVGNARHYPDDSLRPLTAEGVKYTKEAALGMKRLGLEFTHAYSSPYLRALRTADITLKTLGLKIPIKTSHALVPEASFEELISFLKPMDRKSKVLLAGHEPAFGMFISCLISYSPIAIDFKKGSLCRVDVKNIDKDAPAGVFKWLLTNDILRGE